jgi:ubiquinone/menaquinone biosynthesis C-methylase UbiE
MSGESGTVAAHYATSGLGARILAALEAEGVDTHALSPEILAPIDQLHTRGWPATVDLAAWGPFTNETRVLDIGCGIGGPARYLAKTHGCHVTGIDLMEDFVDAARLLSERSGLAHLTEFQAGDAADLPFADASFDVVWSQNVVMNIADKQAFFGGIARVLKPGGIFTGAEMGLGLKSDPIYPLMWAREPSISYLLTPDETRAALVQAGFKILDWFDSSAPRPEGARKKTQPVPDGAVENLDTVLVLGAEMPERIANSAQNQKEGRLVTLTYAAEKVG